MKSALRISATFLILVIIQACSLLRPSYRKADDASRGPGRAGDTLPVRTDIFDDRPDTTIIPKDTVYIPVDAIIEIPGQDTFSIVMVGDVMLGTDYPSPNYLPPGNNCYPLLEPLKNEISDADISFCNLEGGFAGGKGVPKSCKDPVNCYVFSMPEGYVNCLTDAGFDLVSVANNHVNDFGAAGRMNTMKVLESSGLHFAGFIEKPFTIFEKNGFVIGFCAFAPHSGVADLRDKNQAAAIVKMLDDTCDIVIVSMHAGAEGRNHQRVTRKKEEFLGADRGNVYEFARAMIDAGADVIIGHGPHVTRGMEVYKDRFIAYSLGNFSTYARFNLSGPNGIAPLVKINLDREGRVLGGKITAINQLGEGGATHDPEGRVIHTIRSLNVMDFPDNLLHIEEDGTIRL